MDPIRSFRRRLKGMSASNEASGFSLTTRLLVFFVAPVSPVAPVKVETTEPSSVGVVEVKEGARLPEVPDGVGRGWVGVRGFTNL